MQHKQTTSLAGRTAAECHRRQAPNINPLELTAYSITMASNQMGKYNYSNAQDRHTAADAKINDLEEGFDKLFNECQTECEGMSIDDANFVWRLKYKSRYEAMDRLLDAAFICYWYTDPQNSLHNKQVNHRATVAKMRVAGLHRMATVK